MSDTKREPIKSPEQIERETRDALDLVEAYLKRLPGSAAEKSKAIDLVLQLRREVGAQPWQDMRAPPLD